jgi:hypothetical protein
MRDALHTLHTQAPLVMSLLDVTHVFGLCCAHPRFYQELDFPWCLDPQLVLQLIPQVVDVVAQEVARVYADQIPAGAKPQVGLAYCCFVTLLSRSWMPKTFRACCLHLMLCASSCYCAALRLWCCCPAQVVLSA